MSGEKFDAPGPWRIAEPNKHYFSIVDAAGREICDFFPYADKHGRGWEETVEIAKQIVEWERHREKKGSE